MAGGGLLWLQFVRAIRLLRPECVRGFGRLRLSAFQHTSDDRVWQRLARGFGKSAPMFAP